MTFIDLVYVDWVDWRTEDLKNKRERERELRGESERTTKKDLQKK